MKVDYLVSVDSLVCMFGYLYMGIVGVIKLLEMLFNDDEVKVFVVVIVNVL